MAFKDLFIKEEEPQQIKPVVVQEVAPSAENIMSSPPPSNIGKVVDKEIETKIWDMIVAKNLPGAIVIILMLVGPVGLIILIREIRRAPLHPDDFDPHSDDF